MEFSAHALRYFAVLCEELHFGRAAARLHLTPSSLSEQVSRLEKRLAADLFLRGPRGVELTAVARELLPLARAVVAAHDDVAAWAAARSVRGGSVRVGVVAAAAAPLRSAVLDAVARRFPQVEVGSRRIGFQEEAAALRDGLVDVAYAPEPLPRPARGLRWASVAREPRVLVVPAGHRLAGREAVSVEETNSEVFLTVRTADPATTAWWLVDPRADGSSPARGASATDIEEVLDLCAAGRGLNIATASTATHYARPGVAFVPLRDVPDAGVALCWRAEEADPAVLAYVALARELAP